MHLKAYSVLKINGAEEDSRVIRGIATTPTPDRMGDIVDSAGARYSERIPLLRGHMNSQPVGHAMLGKAGKNGIPFTAEIVKIDEPGPLKERVDTAWLEVKSGLVQAVSIGFRPLKWSYMDDGGTNYEEFEIFELSLVTIPANAQAVITQVKSFEPLPREVVSLLRGGAVRIREVSALRGAVSLR